MKPAIGGIPAIENKIIETVNLLRSDIFPKPSFNCEYCNYIKKRWHLSIT